MTPRSTQNFIEYLRDTIIGCKYCFKSCKSNHFYDRFEVGRQKLQKETNIVQIVKQLRFHEAIISTLTTQPQRAHLKAKSRYKYISFATSDDQESEKDCQSSSLEEEGGC